MPGPGRVADEEVVQVHPSCAELQLHLRAERGIAMQAGSAFGHRRVTQGVAEAVAIQHGEGHGGGVAVVGGQRVGQIEHHRQVGFHGGRMGACRLFL